MSNIYTGVFLRKVDGCYRVGVPRQLTFQNDEKGCFLYYDKAKKLIRMYPRDHIGEIADMLEKNGYDEENSTLAIALDEGSFVNFDKYHKILLPQNMREVVGESKTVAVIGVFDHLEIMAVEQYEQITSEANFRI